MVLFDIYPEMECGDVIHNHFDCPICKKLNASTDCYGGIHVLVFDIEDKVLRCEECGAEFKILKHMSYDYGKWEWKVWKVN